MQVNNRSAKSSNSRSRSRSAQQKKAVVVESRYISEDEEDEFSRDEEMVQTIDNPSGGMRMDRLEEHEKN